VIADISVPDWFATISIPGLGSAFIERRARKMAQTVASEVEGQPRQQDVPAGRLTRIQDDKAVRDIAPAAL